MCVLGKGEAVTARGLSDAISYNCYDWGQRTVKISAELGSDHEKRPQLEGCVWEEGAA